MSWYPADGYIVIVDHAENALADAVEERDVVFSILSDCAQHRANHLDVGGVPKVLFRPVLLAADGAVDALRDAVVNR